MSCSPAAATARDPPDWSVPSLPASTSGGMPNGSIWPPLSGGGVMSASSVDKCARLRLAGGDGLLIVLGWMAAAAGRRPGPRRPRRPAGRGRARSWHLRPSWPMWRTGSYVHQLSQAARCRGGPRLNLVGPRRARRQRGCAIVPRPGKPMRAARLPCRGLSYPGGMSAGGVAAEVLVVLARRTRHQWKAARRPSVANTSREKRH